MIRKAAKIPFIAALVGALISTSAVAGEFEVLQKFRIGGEGAWDFLAYDSQAKRLFISRARTVQVVDTTTGALVGQITDTPGVHGIALAPELDKGFTSNGGDNSITVFTASTLKTSSKIMTPGGENPDFIAYDEVSKRVVAFNARSRNASIIDANREMLVTTISLAGKPEAAVTDGRGMMFVEIEDKNVLQAINLKARPAVVSTWPLPGCEAPAGLAMDKAARRLFVGCQNKTMLVIDADTGATVAKLDIGEGVDASAFDAERKLVFSSQADGTLSIIQAGANDQYQLLQTVKTAYGARTLALNPVDHRVYLVTADFEVRGGAAVMKPGTFSLLVVGEKAP